MARFALRHPRRCRNLACKTISKRPRCNTGGKNFFDESQIGGLVHVHCRLGEGQRHDSESDVKGLREARHGSGEIEAPQQKEEQRPRSSRCEQAPRLLSVAFDLGPKLRRGEPHRD